MNRFSLRLCSEKENLQIDRHFKVWGGGGRCLFRFVLQAGKCGLDVPHTVSIPAETGQVVTAMKPPSVGGSINSGASHNSSAVSYVQKSNEAQRCSIVSLLVITGLFSRLKKTCYR